MKKMVLLNVGPVMVSGKVRNALLQADLCHREIEFAEMLNRIRERLTRVFGGNSEYATIVFGGSGTASLEAVISSAVKRKKLLVLSNGYYGEKIASVARIHKINVRILRHKWGERINESKVASVLKSDSRLKFVAMVHNETSTGMLNQITDIGNLVSEHGGQLLVDAISSVGVEDLDVVRDSIHFCVGSPNKCIESIPGLSFVCANREKLKELSDLAPATSYLDLYSHYLYEEGSGERLGTPFTPPVQALYALDVALEVLLEEGIENRRRRYALRAKIIRDGLERLGFKLLLPPEFRCNSITAVLTPKNISYKTLHDGLKKRGFIIYAGQGNFEETMFRVGNMGALTTRDLNRFLDSLQSVFKELNQHPCYSEGAL
jgi:2-aminoethylphosphonate-pyruvate transaminase